MVFLTKQRASRLLNISLLLALAVFIGLLVRRYYSNQKPPIIGRSAKIAISGIDLSKTPHSLVLAVNTDCKYCTDSARFYRRLVQGLANRKDMRMIIVFPESTAQGRWYLNSLGIAVADSGQIRLSSIGIRNVPTLALVDQNGVVSNVWIGQLSPGTESEVMQAVGMADTRPTEDWLINEQQIEKRRHQGEKLIVVDLGDRAEFGQSHLANSVNIPIDELSARAQNELPQTATIVLYSRDAAIADRSYQILSKQAFPHLLILDHK